MEKGDGRGGWWRERERGEGRRAKGERRARDARKNATRSREHVTAFIFTRPPSPPSSDTLDTQPASYTTRCLCHSRPRSPASP
jgi:hypothetical protein